jgi:hypothetical protein
MRGSSPRMTKCCFVTIPDQLRTTPQARRTAQHPGNDRKPPHSAGVFFYANWMDNRSHVFI